MDKPAEKDKPATLGTRWIEKIRKAGERENAFLKSAQRAENIYLNRTEEGATKKFFNILHSNIETIVPAIYSATPKPDIRRRFNDTTALAAPDDPMAQQKAMMDEAYRQAATVIERAIIVQTDDGAIDREMEALAAASFMAGRGIIRVKVIDEEPQTGEIDDDVTEDARDTALNESKTSATETEDDSEDMMETQASIQRLGYEVVSWRDFRRGPATRWDGVPWIAFRHQIPEETVREWSKDEAVATQLKALPPATSDGAETLPGDTEVWEIWDKERKKVMFVRASDGIIFKNVADPLGLTNFFPVAQPVQPITRIGDLMPVCPFEVYEELSKELDETSRRIVKIIKGIKVRGGAAVGELFKGVSEIATLEDNEIAEIRGVEAFTQQGGLEKAITWWPIEKAIEALQALSAHREVIKATIYEVTGISDIVRGASNAQETARAQEIKSQWGSLRIQKMQRLIENCVREVFIISAELIAEKFTPQTLSAITGIEWNEGIADVFRDRVSRVYRIDVETDSTIKSDMSKSKQEMAEFLNGTAQFFQTMAPMAQAGFIPQNLLMDLYAPFARTFRLGRQAEDAIEQAAQQAKQAPPPPSPEIQQQMQQLQQQNQQLQEELAKLQQENQAVKSDKSAEMQKAQLDGQIKVATTQQDMALKQQEHDMKMGMAAQQNRQKMEQNAVAADQKNKLMAQQAKLRVFSGIK